VGTGLGLSAGPVLIAVQSTVGWEHRGVVTGTNMFSRSLGQHGRRRHLRGHQQWRPDQPLRPPVADVAGHLPDVDSAAVCSADPPGRLARRGLRARAVYDATHHVFVVMIAVAAVSIAALLLMPAAPSRSRSTEGSRPRPPARRRPLRAAPGPARGASAGTGGWSPIGKPQAKENG